MNLSLFSTGYSSGSGPGDGSGDGPGDGSDCNSGWGSEEIVGYSSVDDCSLLNCSLLSALISVS